MRRGDGWYKETPDQNILLPHDVLRILIQLLAWGDIEVARRLLPEHKARLYADIQERLEFEKSEIQLRSRDEIAERDRVLQKLADKTVKNAEREKLDKRVARLDEEMEKMERELAGARHPAKRHSIRTHAGARCGEKGFPLPAAPDC